jgi:hypothetical protein
MSPSEIGIRDARTYWHVLVKLIQKRSRLRQFCLMLSRKLGNQLLRPTLKTAIHCLNPPFWWNMPCGNQKPEAAFHKNRAKYKAQSAPGEAAKPVPGFCPCGKHRYSVFFSGL